MLVCGYCFVLCGCLLCTKYFSEPSEVFLTVQVVEVERWSWTLGGKPCLKTHCSTESESGCNSHPDRDSSQNAPTQHTHADHSQCSSECWPTVSPYVDSWGSVDLGWFLQCLVPRCQLALLGLFLVSLIYHGVTAMEKMLCLFKDGKQPWVHLKPLLCQHCLYHTVNMGSVGLKCVIMKEGVSICCWLPLLVLLAYQLLQAKRRGTTSFRGLL